jgi:RHS repeat-associated protein
VSLNYKFAGKERDSESGLDYFGARYNSSSLGRFMSPDPENSSGYDNPTDPQGWNAYSYVRNNPLNLTDPDGRDYKVCVDNGNGGQNCTIYSHFEDFQKATDASNATLNGNDKNGQILVNGKSIGTYQFFPDPGATYEDNILAPALVGGLVGGVKAGIRGIAEGLFGGGARTAAEEATVATVESTVQTALRTGGGVIDRVVQTAAGPVRVYAKVTAEGSTAVIKELAVYPTESGTAINVGYTGTRQVFKAVLSDLKEAGFTDFRMEPQYRVGGANAGGFTGTLKGKL